MQLIRQFASIAATSLALLAPVAGQAGAIAEAAAAVEAAIAANDFAAWQAANTLMLETLWVAPGLHFSKLMLVRVPATGFGSYEQRADNVYAVGESVLIYAEPAGYGYGDLGGGKFEIAFDLDLTITDPAGAVLAEIPNIIALVYPANGKPREFLANITYDLNGVTPGEYTLNTTFRDRHSGQSSSFTSDIVVQ